MLTKRALSLRSWGQYDTTANCAHTGRLAAVQTQSARQTAQNIVNRRHVNDLRDVRPISHITPVRQSGQSPTARPRRACHFDRWRIDPTPRPLPLTTLPSLSGGCGCKSGALAPH